MRLETLEYRDNETGWTLERMKFHPNLTLLVGVSGAGKTRILRAITSLRRLATGLSHLRSEPTFAGEPWGVNWSIEFAIGPNPHLYRWNGEYEKRRDMPGYEARARLLKERLQDISEGEEIFLRDLDGLQFRGKETPRLAETDAAIRLLSGEESVGRLVEGFLHITTSTEQLPDNELAAWVRSPDELRQFPWTGEMVRRVPAPIGIKLVAAYLNSSPIFAEACNRFISIFPTVQEVRLVQFRDREFTKWRLELKESGAANWIAANDIASGMHKSFLHIAGMLLSPDGSVILIDEFENSLGVNCLDAVTDLVLEQSRRIQFVITSHHPYIINNIPPEHWRIVTRKGPVVTTHEASEFGIGQSRHKWFMQLINTPEYSRGISSP